jgi:hypothetical protein
MISRRITPNQCCLAFLCGCGSDHHFTTNRDVEEVARLFPRAENVGAIPERTMCDDDTVKHDVSDDVLVTWAEE